MKIRKSNFKFFILFFAMGIFLFSCVEAEKKNESRIDSLVSLPIPLDTVNGNVIQKDSIKKDTANSHLSDSLSKKTIPYNGPTPEIGGEVFYNLPYCGGARPTEEILVQLAIWKPLTNSTLEFRNKSRGYLISINKDGFFSEAIPEGNYDVFLTRKVNKEIYNVEPNACENCLTEPIAKIKLVLNGKNEIRFTFRCDPGARMRP